MDNFYNGGSKVVKDELKDEIWIKDEIKGAYYKKKEDLTRLLKAKRSNH